MLLHSSSQQLNAIRQPRAVAFRDPLVESPAEIALRKKNRDAAEKLLAPDPTLPAPKKNGTIETPSQQCTANTKAGAHCRQRTAIGQYCWSHLKSIEGLRVKVSDVAGGGRGLFAARSLPAFKRIPYTGDLIYLRADQSGGTYVLQTRRAPGRPGETEAIDAARRNSGYGRWVNDPRGTGLRANAQFVLYTPPGGAQRIADVETTRVIAQGEEILVKYGNSYWNYHEAASKRKPRKQAERNAVAVVIPPPAPPQREVVEIDAVETIIARPASELTLRIVAAASKDAEYQQQLKQPPFGFVVAGGMLFDDTRMIVPNNAELRTAILAECHDSVTGAHFGRDKTLEAIRRRFA